VGREVYPNAPLRLVAAEFRFPYAPKLASTEVLEELTTTLRPTFPLPTPTAMQVVMTTTIGGTSQSTGPVNRFLTKDRTASVTVSPTNIVIETTEYHEYEKFRPLLAICLAALGSVRGAIVGLERVGLRYVNEVRVPNLSGAPDWTKYFASNLVAPLHLVQDRSVGVMQAVVQTDPIDGMVTVFRFGALRGQVVAPGGPLRVAASPTDSPFFMLDIDNSWSSGESFDAFSVETALNICDRLHDPIDALFEAVISNELRKIFRRPV
jgi:uncharacterized protein (TIGR04255 family)